MIPSFSLDILVKKRKKKKRKGKNRGYRTGGKTENKQYLEAFGLWITINSRSRAGKQRWCFNKRRLLGVSNVHFGRRPLSFPYLNDRCFATISRVPYVAFLPLYAYEIIPSPRLFLIMLHAMRCVITIFETKCKYHETKLLWKHFVKIKKYQIAWD